MIIIPMIFRNKQTQLAIVVLCYFFCVGLLPSLAQSPKIYFGNKYLEVLDFVQINKQRWIDGFGSKDAAKMIAIVFPEMLRYNENLEEIETQLLKSLYVRFGNRYADFSIGYFQMKPSFAEKIEESKGKKLEHTPPRTLRTYKTYQKHRRTNRIFERFCCYHLPMLSRNCSKN